MAVDLAVDAVVADLDETPKKVTSNEDQRGWNHLVHGGDAEINREVPRGRDGKKVSSRGVAAVITVEEAKVLETELEVVEGIQVDHRGYLFALRRH